MSGMKRMTPDQHAGYIHLCGMTGGEIDALPVETCSRCLMVLQCENDHVIVDESWMERILREEVEKLHPTARGVEDTSPIMDDAGPAHFLLRVEEYNLPDDDGSYLERKRRGVWYLSRQDCTKIREGDRVIFHLSNDASDPLRAGCVIGYAVAKTDGRHDPASGRCVVMLTDWKEFGTPILLSYLKRRMEGFRGLSTGQYAVTLRRGRVQISKRDYETILKETEPVSWIIDDNDIR
ncbi:MAG: hypothetical protein ACE5Z5_13715 [Candidatus Bathyarchaeia archaeon]